ncbi:MAG: GNAT family N-acetyltransferase, partial [Muribaculaceae bacterium]|nr:GNAT family N-acetyltransferase [Muribaculaceae bacterium]
MSDTKSDIMKIWRECFPADSPEWVEMYFNREYSPECALTSVDDRGNTVSSLMLQPYTMTFHGQEAGVSYVSGAATMPRHRNQGHMTRLIQQAILASHSRGDMLCALIPANDMLRQYYARSGFASVFFSRLHRYTSAHIFSSHSNYIPVAADDQTALYNAYRNLAHLRPCAIIHTPHQFGTIMIDN